MNEMLWFVMLLINFGAILFAYRMWGKAGLYIWVPIATILANIQVLKTIHLFGMTATLGNIVYATSFLVTDILSENYGKKEAKRAVKIGFFAVISMTVLMNMAIYFVPSADDFGNESIKTIFGFMPRIMIASLSAYWISQHHDVWAYEFWKNKFPETKFIWLRNNASTMVSQFIDSLIFTLIAFWGVFEAPVMIQILISTYVIKWIVAAADTPFVYIAKSWKDKNKIQDEILNGEILEKTV